MYLKEQKLYNYYLNNQRVMYIFAECPWKNFDQKVITCNTKLPQFYKIQSTTQYKTLVAKTWKRGKNTAKSE